MKTYNRSEVRQAIHNQMMDTRCAEKCEAAYKAIESIQHMMNNASVQFTLEECAALEIARKTMRSMERKYSDAISNPAIFETE